MNKTDKARDEDRKRQLREELLAARIPENCIEMVLSQVCSALGLFHWRYANPSEFPTQRQKRSLLKDVRERADNLLVALNNLPVEMHLAIRAQYADIDFENVIELLKEQAQAIEDDLESSSLLERLVNSTALPESTDVAEVAALLQRTPKEIASLIGGAGANGPQGEFRALLPLLESMTSIWEYYNPGVKGVTKRGASPELEGGSRHNGPLLKFVCNVLRIEGVFEWSDDQLGERLIQLLGRQRS